MSEQQLLDKIDTYSNAFNAEDNAYEVAPVISIRTAVKLSKARAELYSLSEQE